MSNKKMIIKAPRIIESTKPQMVVDQIRELRELGIHCIYSMKFVDKACGKKVFQAVLERTTPDLEVISNEV